MDWLHKNGYLSKSSLTFISIHIMQYGEHDAMQLILDNNIQLEEQHFIFGAMSGKIEVVEWLKRHKCPWNHQVPIQTAYKNDLKMLIWLKDNGCTFDAGVYWAALSHGHFPVLEWALENNYPFDSSLYRAPFPFGQKIDTATLKKVDWLIDHKCPLNQEVAEWLKKWEPKMCEYIMDRLKKQDNCDHPPTQRLKK